ncbi:hypothetical protein HED42_08815 [Enterococcus casseliflavus]|uniref:hypothetical protein n=1 Tax=Enterococcus casseliflavus TaxID=37734 RepID=UPI001432F84F|nr:hypothetical protein [Enterococcus casseliflavus]NKD38233.1 hypothetical protein [Enterococcus casseliflavus]
MAVDKLLPVGTKVRIVEEHAHLNVGNIYTITEVENHLDGQSHRIDEYSRNSNGWWVNDSAIEVVREAPEEMKRKKVTFAEIVQMIAEGEVPSGAKFYTPSRVFDVELSASMVGGTLHWDSGKVVQLAPDVINDSWYMETPELKLSALEAMAELQKGNAVKGSHGGEDFTLSPYDDFEDLWDDSPLADMDDLLNHTEFYKVAA